MESRIKSFFASKAVSAKSCKQINDITFKDVVSEALDLQAEEPQLDNAGAITRRGYVGSMTNLGSMENLDRRTRKTGGACGVEKFDALDYPESANMPATAKFYHFTDPTAFDALDFAGEAKEAKDLKRTDYQIEHILEWQVVTKFFEWVQTKKADEKFDNPDPKRTNKLKFCPYWKATWEGANSPVFELKPDDKKDMNALDHLRHAYPAKAQMWSTKNTDKSYGDKTTKKIGGKVKPNKVSTGMTDLIVGTNKAGKIPQSRPTVNSARQAYLKLKWILGARIYLKNAEIQAIFKKQKERIGDVLDALDTAMETQPKRTKTGDVMNAWKKQNLKVLWNEYMEEKFAAAKKRSENDTDKYVRLLEGKWSQKKDLDAAENDRIVFLLQIRKLKATWDTEKKNWIAPWK
ncbi:glycosyl hydrolases family 18 protein [Stagonosporopsis vannaccii]|nr:glycosyl hydrolases family 18 protein [Stagonosporopsis vannaccii]